MNDDEVYDVYVRSYGKVRSGNKIDHKDYGTSTMQGFVPYEEACKVAVSVAVDDVKAAVPLRSKKDLLARVRALLS
jgi:hypothetical protein